MEFKLFTFSYDNNGMWEDAYLNELFAKYYYIDHGFKKSEIINFRNKDIQDLIKEYPKHFDPNDCFNFRYGYYLWKYYLLLKIMDKVNYGDIIIYSDVGSLINGENIKKFYYDFLVKNNYEFFYNSESFPAYRVCKKDLFIQMDIDYDKYKDITLFMGSGFAYKKTNRSIYIIKEIFKNLSVIENVDQINRIEKEVPEDFLWHISDQAVITMTLIKLGVDITTYRKEVNEFLNIYNNNFMLYHILKHKKEEELIKHKILAPYMKLKNSGKSLKKIENVLKSLLKEREDHILWKK